MNENSDHVLSDPKAGAEESTGRVFNALAAAYDFKQKGDEVKIIFQGAGTRWSGYLTKPDHPLHQLYKAVADKVAASCGCGDVFGASEDLAASGWDLVKDNPVPGTSGTPSFHKLITDGYGILTF